MANTMLNGTATPQNGNNPNFFSKFLEFRKQIMESGKDPQTILNELLTSGKVSKNDVDKATMMAKTIASII